MVHDPLSARGIAGSALDVQEQSARLMRVREILCGILAKHTGKPLKQISVDVGFSSLSTFYTLFQSTTGMTPARYRSKLKEV